MSAAAYDRALSNLAVLDVVPAWASTRLKRLTKAGKRYLVDTGLAAAAADVDEQEVVRDGDLRGRWFDAFAAMQLRAEFATSSPRRTMHHLRGESFVGGIVLHSGQAVVELDDRIAALPLSAMWAPHGGASPRTGPEPTSA